MGRQDKPVCERCFRSFIEGTYERETPGRVWFLCWNCKDHVSELDQRQTRLDDYIGTKAGP